MSAPRDEKMSAPKAEKMSAPKAEKIKQSDKSPKTSKVTRPKESARSEKSQTHEKGKKKAESKRKSSVSEDGNLDPKDVGDLVICRICKNDICSPKYLPCLHTFCETCIIKHIDQERSRGTNMHVICPTCEYQISVPRPSDDTKSYAESLPISTLISSLLGKKDLHIRRCKICKLQGEDSKADNWCAYCAQTLCDKHLKYHESLTGGRHPVFDVDEVIRNPDIGYASKKCKFHEKEEMKLFCNDHWNVCCKICSKRLHNMCNTCFIEYDAATIKTHGEVANLKKRLDNLATHTEKMRQDILTNIEDINKQVQREKENIKEFRIQINKHLDKLEEKLIHELDEMHVEKLKELEKEAKTVDKKNKSALLYKTMLSVIMKDTTNIQSLSNLADIKQNAHRLEDEIRLDKKMLQKIGILVQLNHDTFSYMTKIGIVSPKYARLRTSQSPSRASSSMTKSSSPRMNTSMGASMKFYSSPRLSER